jgi:hypothetical protein
MKSNKRFMIILITVLTILFLIVIGNYVRLVGWIVTQNSAGSRQLRNLDTVQLAYDCRSMMTDFGKCQNLLTPKSKIEKVELWANRGEIGSNVPLSIRKLNPTCIVMQTNMIQICLSAPIRTKLVGFPKGVEGCGSAKLDDGLWIWGQGWVNR